MAGWLVGWLFDWLVGSLASTTGNEGAPYSRWYQRAAILIWPRQSRINLLGCEAAFGMIHAAINGDKSAICGYELLHAEPIGRHTRQDDCDL